MATFVKSANGTVIYTDDAGEVYGLSAENDVIPFSKDENIILIGRKTSPTKFDEVIRVDHRTVTTPTSTSRSNLVTQLAESFFFSVGGRGGQRVSFVPSASPFATVAARNTWAAANLTELHNDNSQVTVVTVDDGTDIFVYEWGGADMPASHDPGGWILRVMTSMDGLGESSLNWSFSSSTDGSDPGTGNLALNNAAKASATAINYNITSGAGAARFDEYLRDLTFGIYIFLRERTATNVSALYRVEGNATLDVTRVDVPVSVIQTQGGEFTPGAVIDVRFLPSIPASISSLNDISDTRFPFRSGATFADSALRETATQLISDKEIVTTPTSIIFGLNGAEISSAGQAAVFSGTDGDNAFMLMNKFNPGTGSLSLIRSRLVARSDYTIQGLKDVNSSPDPSFTYTINAVGNPAEDRRHTDQVTVEAADSGTALVTFRETDQNGRLLRIQSVTFTADTEIAVDLERPICLDVGTVVHVSVVGQGSTIRLKGTTIATEFSPFLKVRAHLGYDDEIISDFNAVRSRIRSELVEFTSNVVINSANLATYNRKTLLTPNAQSTELTITITEGINLDYFDLAVLGTGAVRVIASGSDRINGESDIRFTNLQGGRIQKMDSNDYCLIFDNTDPDMTDNYVESGSLSGTILTLVRTGNLADVTVDLAAIAGGGNPLTTVNNYDTTGTQNVGTDLAGTVSVLSSTITGFDLLIGTTLTTDSLFVISKQGSGTAEFDVSATPYNIINSNVDPDAYNIQGDSTVLFYFDGTNIYPISDTGTVTGTSDHPVVLTRDTPSLTDLANLANASLNNNSALWVLASDQVAATESGVDPSIMIRALEGGLLDANGVEISTTATQKSGVVLQGGTIVRIFSSTDLRVVSAPATVAQEMRYPDIPFSGALRLEESDEALYNTYVRRTATNAGGSNQYIALPDLHTANRPSWVREGDVFVMRHTGSTTGTQRPHFRPDNTGDNIAGHGLRYYADPGQTIAVQAPRFGLRTWQLFPVSQRSDGNVYYDPEVMLADWYRDDTDSTAVDNSVRLHNRHDLADGLVRDHIRESSSSNNPIVLNFQRKNYQDSIAWIQWWSAMGAAVPPLGTTANEILENIPTSLAWIETNINNGYDFQFNAPEATIAISAITNDGGNSFRIEIPTALPTWFAVNDEITITGATNAGNNGTFSIDSIAGDRLLFNITNASGVNESGSGAFTQKTIYADAVLVSHDLRQTNFNLYEDSARTSPQTINLNWFDKDNTGGDSALSIGYNTDVTTRPPAIQLEDDNGDFFVSLAPPRGQVFDFDNTGGNYQNARYLPLNYEDIHIRTDGTCQFFFDLHPDDLPSGQRRRYSVYSDVNNDDDDVTISVGRSGSTIDFDEGLSSLSILNGTNQAIEIYNDGANSGVRIVQPFEKYVPSASLTNVVTPAEGPLAMSISDIVAAESQDPNRSFYTINSNKITLKGAFRYILTYRVKLRFDGDEDTGLSFVNVELVPTRERNSVTTDLSRETGNSQIKIDFVRNGNNTDDNTKPVYTLIGSLFYYAQPDDKIGWELRFGQFPAGYTISDLRQIERQYTITVKGGID